MISPLAVENLSPPAPGEAADWVTWSLELVIRESPWVLRQIVLLHNIEVKGQ